MRVGVSIFAAVMLASCGTAPVSAGFGSATGSNPLPAPVVRVRPEPQPTRTQGDIAAFDGVSFGVRDGVVTAQIHLLNRGQTPDRLLRVEAPEGVAVGDIRIAIMSCGEWTPVDPDRPMEFPVTPAPGAPTSDRIALRIDLTNVPRAGYAGTVVPLTLVFERSGAIQVDVTSSIPTVARPGFARSNPGCS